MRGSCFRGEASLKSKAASTVACVPGPMHATYGVMRAGGVDAGVCAFPDHQVIGLPAQVPRSLGGEGTHSRYTAAAAATKASRESARISIRVPCPGHRPRAQAPSAHADSAGAENAPYGACRRPAGSSVGRPRAYSRTHQAPNPRVHSAGQTGERQPGPSNRWAPYFSARGTTIRRAPLALNRRRWIQ